MRKKRLLVRSVMTVASRCCLGSRMARRGFCASGTCNPLYPLLFSQSSSLSKCMRLTPRATLCSSTPTLETLKAAIKLATGCGCTFVDVETGRVFAVPKSDLRRLRWIRINSRHFSRIPATRSANAGCRKVQHSPESVRDELIAMCDSHIALNRSAWNTS